MKKIVAVLLIFSSFVLPATAQKASFGEVKQLQSPQNPKLGFMIHGGAGVIKQGSLTPEKEKEYRAKLEEALMAGYKALQAGKSSVDAVQIAINILEDSPLFNAGKGAVFNADGKNELDASIMDGKTLMAGAVAGVHHVKNPITLARAVMEKSPHVMLAGDGAEQFAREQNIELVDEKYFFTQERWDAFQQVKKEESQSPKPAGGLGPKSNIESPKTEDQKPKTETQNPKTQDQKPPTAEHYADLMTPTQLLPENKFGTVGAVALDKDGNIAAGTSTGGMTNKKYGRIGDSPIIGAGTYANNNSCAVSATGWGEYFIRLSVARDICAQIEYRAFPIQQSADMVMKKVQTLGGDGGVIAIDKFGNMAVSFNSEGMYRAYIDGSGKPIVEIYK